MKNNSFVTTLGYIISASLVLGLVPLLTFESERRQEEITDSSLQSETTNINMAETQNTHVNSTNDIRETLAKMNEKLAYQLSEIEKLSLENRQNISELAEFIGGNIPDDEAEISYDNNTENTELDSDYRQEQELLFSESHQNAYMQQVDDLFMQQEEDISWSAQVESDFSSAFENYIGQVQLSNVSCGDSMCKVSANIIDADNTTPDKLPPLDHIIHGDAEWQGQSLYKMDLDTGEITLYLMRDGIDLPKQHHRNI
jgi:hypothetical protein